jgi:hypothetical protein
VSYVVISHTHDEEASIYRLIVGREVTDVVPMLDEDGLAMLDEDGEALTEQRVIAYEDVRDYLFADDDKRWQRRSLEDVARVQRDLVREAIDTASAAPPATLEPRALPGVGEAL